MIDPQHAISGEIAHAHHKVLWGEQKASLPLPRHLRYFLTGFVMEYLRFEGDVIGQAFGLVLTSGTCSSGKEFVRKLKRAGDGALLLAGLLPDDLPERREQIRNISLAGQAQYAHAAALYLTYGVWWPGHLCSDIATLFFELARVFRCSCGPPHE